MLLAIETSCDETAVAVVDLTESLKTNRVELRCDLISSQVKFHAPYGGVVPELASRMHLENLPFIVQRALSEAGTEVNALRAVVVTQGPGLKGCLLVGLSFAKALAYSRNLPLLVANHLEGHVYAGELLPDPPQYPMLCLVVSGGHTMLVFVRKFRDYDIIAQTRDDAAGEAFDKIATLLGLPYPGGPNLSRLAEKGDPFKYPLPEALKNDPSAFSFSGLKTAVRKLYENLGAAALGEEERANIAASSQRAIVKTLVDKSVAASQLLNPRSFVLTGGVAANSLLRAELATALQPLGVPCVVPPAKWCTDNAAMIGALGVLLYREQRVSFEHWEKQHREEQSMPVDGFLGPGVSVGVDAKARWPLSDLSLGMGVS